MSYTAAEQESAAAAVKPILWARLSVNHTKKTWALSCLAPLICLVVITFTGSLSVNNPGSADYVIRNDIRTRLSDAREAAFDEFRYTGPGSSDNGSIEERTDKDGYFALSVLFRGRVGENGQIGVTNHTSHQATKVLTKEGLKLMKEAEDALIATPEYNHYCWRNFQFFDCEGQNLDCALPRSILLSPHLYGKYKTDVDGSMKLCGRKNGTMEITDEAFEAFKNSLVVKDTDGTDIPNPIYIPLMGTDFSVKSQNTWITQSQFFFGRPFKKYEDLDDRETEQTKEYENWATDMAKHVKLLTLPTIDVFPIGSALLDASFGSIVLRDLSFSIVAIILVFIVICIHTTSPFLACTAMAQIFLAFPFAYVIYTYVFRQDYFAALQILVIFLILGIGADDVFVFTDAWKQSAVVLGPTCDLVTRMSWTYRRSVRAMAVTSVTTAAAFFVTAVSPIMPISTLGIWAGVLILLQFVLVITMYPCAVALWHRFWRVRDLVNCFRAPTEEQLNAPQVSIFQRCLPRKWRKNPSPDGLVEYRTIEKFFRGPWVSFILRFRYFFIALAVVLVGLCIWLATRLEAPVESEEFFPDSNEFMVALNAIEDSFPRSQADFQLRVRITWGIEDVDRTGTSRFEPSDPGKVILDDTFEFTSAAAQRHVLKTCDFFEKQTRLIFQDKTIDEPVTCWIRDFERWRVDQGKNDFEDYPNDEAFIEELIDFGTYTTAEGVQPYLGYLTGRDIAFNVKRTKIVFTEIRFVSPLSFSEPHRIMWPVYEDWQEQLAINNKDAPADYINKAIATGGYSWLWQITQIRLVRSMFTGIGIMLGVALVALIVSTFNWACGILATIAIGGIVSMLMGIIYLLGWQLGITESIGVVIAVGYSFDGAAHIMTAYTESHKEDRFGRTRDALTDLGISILFGAISTLLAGFMLFPAIIIFFVKFAGLIVITVSLGLIWSLIFLPAMLLVLGPEKEFGSLPALFRKVFKRTGRQEEGSDSKEFVKCVTEDQGEESPAASL